MCRSIVVKGLEALLFECVMGASQFGAVDPIMAEATARRQDWAAQLGLRSRFGPDGPRTYREVLDVL
jgi:hypothetical protein